MILAMTTRPTRLDPKDRRAQILAAALTAASNVGTDRITFDNVATVAGVSTPLVVHYFRTMTQLRRTVMREAVKQRVVAVVARGLAVDDPYARKADSTLRRSAAEYLTRQAQA